MDAAFGSVGAPTGWGRPPDRVPLSHCSGALTLAACVRSLYWRIQVTVGAAIAWIDTLMDWGMTLIDEVGRLGAGVSIERSLQRFARALASEHTCFLQALSGIPDAARAPYASLLLNRLMFLYFLQKNGLLDGDPHLLQAYLEAAERCGHDRFYSDCLLPLAVGGRPSPLLPAPLSDDALFLPHPLELRYGSAIRIPDAAFARVLAFFDRYTWRLDERASVSDHEMTPAVLGLLTERQPDQKRIGAYYTREDIAGYICRNTIVPFLLTKLARHHREAVLPLSLADVEPYLYPALTAETRLPAETAREHAARLEDLAAMRAAFADGKITTFDDFITYNLNGERFVHDWLDALDDPAVLHTFYFRCLKRLTVLDPTAGSGAFLLAAVELLAPLYELCLEKMARWGEQIPDFEDELARADAAPGRSYFIVHHVIAYNLYGVDLLEPAVEACRQRLFLRLAAAAGAARLEPLPRLDNVRVGNALVGYSAWPILAPIAPGTAQVGHALAHSRAALDAALQREYGREDLDEFVRTHRPFHWCAEFDPILRDGGFDVIVGNPPYVSYHAARSAYTVRGYRTAPCANLYAFVIERSLSLLREQGRLGVIVPIAAISTEAMAPLQRLYRPYKQWHSHFATRPGKLFAGVDMNLTITLLAAPADHESARTYSTTYLRWSDGDDAERSLLFQRVHYVELPIELCQRVVCIPKLGTPIEVAILEKMLAHGRELGQFVDPQGLPVYYHSGGRYWRKALPSRLSSHYKLVRVRPRVHAVCLCLLNSQLFYWYWIAHSNCMDVVQREVLRLPVFDLEAAQDSVYRSLSDQLLACYASNVLIRQRRGARIWVDETNFVVSEAKPILDAIDRTLASDYGLSDAELDFILHYDIKYRMGQGIARSRRR